MQNLKRPNTNKKEILYTLYTYKTERFFLLLVNSEMKNLSPKIVIVVSVKIRKEIQLCKTGFFVERHRL